jgi:hypothetical protein
MAALKVCHIKLEKDPPGCFNVVKTPLRNKKIVCYLKTEFY